MNQFRQSDPFADFWILGDSFHSSFLTGRYGTSAVFLLSHACARSKTMTNLVLFLFVCFFN